MELITVLVLGVLFFSLLWLKVMRPKNFPPGPPALPVLGNILQINLTNPLKDIRKLSKVYGPVYSIYLGFMPVVVIQGLKNLKEVLVNKGVEFANRPYNRLLEEMSGTKGLISARYGQSWKEHRCFTLSTLRNFGLGKKSMEERIREESGYLIQRFRKNKDEILDPRVIIDNAVSNIISFMVFGRRYEYDDPTFRSILNIVHENMKMAGGFWAQLYNAFGFIKYLPLPHQKIFKNSNIVFDFIRKVLEEHRVTRVPGDPRDYIDCYLEELDKNRKDGHNSTFDDENLLICVADLFFAGTASTSATLEWSLLYMMAFPDIQEKCRKEIDDIRGDRGHVTYEDRVRMPYTQAVLQEVQRFASVSPFAFAHSPLNDSQLNGYTIPKGTFIIPDLSALHCDESQWKYPHEFNPENFLNKDGELMKVEAFLPFSAGPRVCLGENLARMEIFLFFTTMLTHFEFHWPDPKSLPDFTPIFGLIQVPKCFKMRLVPRALN
ncbi:cytochrome P450 2J6-like [Hyperolius riggenbachi]|uniref:cytochrome P450 2J6-like n=1 Tax=Hyperolius riggenbachi TaxID=752182 RepID=UPI0035A35416